MCPAQTVCLKSGCGPGEMCGRRSHRPLTALAGRGTHHRGLPGHSIEPLGSQPVDVDRRQRSGGRPWGQSSTAIINHDQGLIKTDPTGIEWFNRSGGLIRVIGPATKASYEATSMAGLGHQSEADEAGLEKALNRHSVRGVSVVVVGDAAGDAQAGRRWGAVSRGGGGALQRRDRRHAAVPRC